jgi:hypothetical protein
MTDQDQQEGEIRDALETTDQLHNDVSRLKRLGILSSQEGHVADEHVDRVADTLTEKLPEE